MFFVTPLVVFLTAIPVVTILREILFSIFVCNLGESKHRRKKANKIHRSQHFFKRVTLSYIDTHIVKHRNAFQKYRKIYKIYVCAIIFVAIVLVGIWQFIVPEHHLLIWLCLTILNCFLFLLLLIVAQVGPDHMTRYDRVMK